MPLFEESGHRGLRRVIDISGDGPNNNGGPVTAARDAAIDKGITINGLPIMLKAPTPWTMDIQNLDFYYEDCVIGGAGSFVVPIQDPTKNSRKRFAPNSSSRWPAARPTSLWFRPVATTPRVTCMIGEQLWQERWGR